MWSAGANMKTDLTSSSKDGEGKEIICSQRGERAYNRGLRSGGKGS